MESAWPSIRQCMERQREPKYRVIIEGESFDGGWLDLTACHNSLDCQFAAIANETLAPNLLLFNGRTHQVALLLKMDT